MIRKSVQRFSVAANAEPRLRGDHAPIKSLLPGKHRLLEIGDAGVPAAEHLVRMLPTPAARPPLGDLVLCSSVVASEARRQGKSLRAHWAHLVVHGTLHLAGYDHQRAADARRMERREIRILRRLGFANPYRS